MKIIFISFLAILNLFAKNYNTLLFDGNCVTCHFKTKAISAPSVAQFKQRYLDAFPIKEDFISNMSKWVQHPNAKTSLMSDAIKKYELMPELGYDLDTLEKISTYIYETDFTKK